NEDVYRRVWPRSFVEVELFIFGGPISNALRRDPFEHRFAGKPASGGNEWLVGCIHTLIVSVVEIFLIDIEPDKRASRAGRGLRQSLSRRGIFSHINFLYFHRSKRSSCSNR